MKKHSRQLEPDCQAAATRSAAGPARVGSSTVGGDQARVRVIVWVVDGRAADGTCRAVASPRGFCKPAATTTAAALCNHGGGGTSADGRWCVDR